MKYHKVCNSNKLSVGDMIEKIKKQWFLIGLVLVCGSVILDPTSVLEMIGRAVKDMNGPSVMIFLIFIISGLMLDSEQIHSGIRDIRATASALVVILVFSPVVALCYSILPLDPSILIGLFIVSVMPTTLSSGVVMTRTAGGNMANALFVTVVSNCIAIFTIPIALDLLLSMVNLDIPLVIDKSAIILKLCVLVLLPLMIGLFIKSVVLKQKDMEKLKLQMINQLLILSILFFQGIGMTQSCGNVPVHQQVNNMMAHTDDKSQTEFIKIGDLNHNR